MITSVAASEEVKAQDVNLLYSSGIVIYRISQKERLVISSLEQDTIEGESPVFGWAEAIRDISKSRVVWECCPNREINFS